VGVVSDAVHNSLRNAPPPTLYLPIAQWDFPLPMLPRFQINVRARAGAASPAMLTHSVTAAIAAIDRDLRLTPRVIEEHVDAARAQERLVALLAAFFGALALLLAALGLYGVTAYAVSRRRHEIGIRLGLGAEPRDVVRLVLRRVTWLVCAGIVIGAAASFWLSHLVAPLLFGLAPRDPFTLAVAAFTLAATGALAGWLPAARASRIDPADVLRHT
jgi:predicted lysophospholipase L1 biosynthesis ABC-type transport system permease subunit